MQAWKPWCLVRCLDWDIASLAINDLGTVNSEKYCGAIKMVIFTQENKCAAIYTKLAKNE